MAKQWNLVMIGSDEKPQISANAPYERRDAVALATNLGGLGIRAWVEHAETGRRFFENEPEQLALQNGRQRIRATKTAIDHGLIPGEVAPEQFWGLLALTRVEPDSKAGQALYDHYVGGADHIEAPKKHGIGASQFGRRMEAIEKASAIAKRLAPFYLAAGSDKPS